MKDFLHRLFIPHHRNNYRAKILHHSTLLSMIVILFFSSFSTVSLKHLSQGVLGISYSISASELLQDVNKARADNNLPPLAMNDVLANAALSKGRDMFAKNYWAHFSPDGTSPWYFIRNSGYDYSYAGENLAKGFTTSQDVVNAWLASPSHRENIMSDKYKDMGFAILEGNLQGEDTVLVVQMFGTGTSSQAIAAVPENTLTEESVPKETGEQVIVPTQSPQTETIVKEEKTTVPVQEEKIVSQNESGVQAASFNQDSIVKNPLINIASLTRVITIGLVSILLLAFTLDVFVIEKKKVPRLVGHNLDHLMLFLIFLIVLITQGAGMIL